MMSIKLFYYSNRSLEWSRPLLKWKLPEIKSCKASLATASKKANTDTHNPSEIQNKWYDLWQKKLKEYNKQEQREIFSMLFPPPNVTGNLHLGHAITATIQDSIVRWKLMNNYRVFWIPGFDHAGIATQVVVEKKIWNERKQTRHDLGKDKFIEEVFKWKEEKHKIIKEQLIKLNALTEWDYEYFTMDKDICRSVEEAFIQLYDQGIIHRAIRPINWCCALKSAISDAEVDVVNMEKKTTLKLPSYQKAIDFGYIYKFAYPLIGEEGELVVATTRPETMFGDTAIALNPLDDRYMHLHGKSAINPLTRDVLPIILDETVDMKFQTGAVKITPSHDLNDYETALRHNLNFKPILTDDGCLKNVPDEFMNIPRFEARWKVIAKLKSINLWRGQSEHAMTLPLCSRTGDVIEPMLKEQWFAKSSKLFEFCSQSIKDKSLRLIPENRILLWNNYSNMYRKKDWCISRQLWWGQRIPAYKCQIGDEEKWFVGRTEEEAKMKAVEHFKTDQVKLEQDNDVFDTWFTSTLLPLAVLGWPQERRSPSHLPLSQLYPTQMLETGFDIMFFWAYRMVGMCSMLCSNKESSNKVPFREIMFHGLIRDALGRKMSKSIGNVIDPNDLVEGVSADAMDERVLNAHGMSEKEKSEALRSQRKIWPKGIEQVGSDAMRLALLVQDFKCDTINIDSNFFKDAKRYCNKIWQAVRYFDKCIESKKKEAFKLLTLNQLIEDSKQDRIIDQWILNELVETIRKVECDFQNGYQLHLVVKHLREFYYGDYCDFYLESSKPLLKNKLLANDVAAFRMQERVWNILRVCNEINLRLYHPFIPSLTEELWQKYEMGTDGQSILDTTYPKYEEISKFQELDTNSIKQVIKSTRSIVNYVLKIKKSIKTSPNMLKLIIKCADPTFEVHLKSLKSEMEHLAKLNNIEFNSTFKPDEDEMRREMIWHKINDKCEILIKIEKNEANDEQTSNV